jgi:curved DNA-binding protein
LKDYYKILGLEKSATPDDIKKAYRLLAMEFHPDKNPNNKEAEAKFKEIAEAYSIIGNETKRKEWDDSQKRRNHQWGNRQYSEDTWGGMSMEDILADLQGTGFEKNFDSIFGHQFNNRSVRGADVKLELKITLEDAYMGMSREININDQTFRINVDKGIHDGAKLRIKDKGNLHPLNSQAPRGDVLIDIKILNNSIYKRINNDLEMTVDIPHLTAILGGNLKVTTLNGTVELIIPELTKQGKLFRLVGKGMPIYRSVDLFGDLYIKCNIITPDKISDEEKELYLILKKIKNESKKTNNN